MSKHYMTSRDIRLRDGTVIPAGVQCQISPFMDSPGVMIVQHDGCNYRFSITRGHMNFRGFPKPPTVQTMEKWSESGIARSVMGKKVEPDGWDIDGWHSWISVLGLI